MKNKQIQFLFFVFFIIKSQNIFSQLPAIEWERTIGGTGQDVLISTCTTSDGVVLGGYSSSLISLDKTESSMLGGTYNYDMWIVKLDHAGNIVWQNNIGTNADDYLAAVVQVADGGFIVGGYTGGGISGDKTETNIGSYDFWILKLDASGNILWQNSIGGSGSDILTDVTVAGGGGCILSGYSNSGISGDKTEINQGDYDYWVVKINPAGVIQWQKTFGGNDADKLITTKKTNDGSFILGGYSESGISGDKTEPVIQPVGTFQYDFWIIKMDELGNIIWQNTVGGYRGDKLYDLILTPDNGYLAVGSSDSNNEVDKSENSFNYMAYYPVYYNGDDCWLVKFDTDGNIEWDQTIGTGSSNEYDPPGSELGISAVITPDGNFLIGGEVELGEYGDIDAISYGGEDYWICKMTPAGQIIWQGTLGGESDYDCGGEGCDYIYGNDWLTEVEVTADDKYYVAGYSESASNGIKSEDFNGRDYWIVKLQHETCTPVPVYADLDFDEIGGAFLFSSCQDASDFFEHYTNTNGDCNDFHAAENSLAEVCDGHDNDCDGSADDGLISCVPAPDVLMQAEYGGDRKETVAAVKSTNDGGYIVGGKTKSGISGNKTEINRDLSTPYYNDYWVVKSNTSGTIEWQKDYGGTNEDYLMDVVPTADGGYLLAGYSISGIGGDKTFATKGSNDYWIIKLDAAGNMIWQKDFGTSSSDYLQAAIQTADGGYLIGGYTTGGISGDKSEASNGSDDFWILKLDNSGNIISQNSIGGSSSDVLKDIEQTDDGNYLLFGYSRSNISGDKNENNISGLTTTTDYWVMKIDASLNILWQNTIGGSLYDYGIDLVKGNDGNYLLAGYSSSGISGDKTETSNGYYDYWAVLINSAGSIIWQNTIGGPESDQLISAISTNDNGYILAGYSDSGPGIDKTGYNLGDQDAWFVKLSSTGNILWDKTYGGNSNDIDNYIAELNDYSIISANTSYSDAVSDKTMPTFGGVYEDLSQADYLLTDADFWIFQFNDFCIPGTEICNSLDDNCNGIADDGVVETINISAGGATTFCQGGSALLTASYSGASVQWKKNGSDIAGATSSTYSATKTGNYSAVTTSPCGTATSSTINVTVNKNPNASISAGGATSFCAGGSVTLTEVAVAGCTYQWYKGANPISGATSTIYIATLAGNYKCRVTKTATGCYKNSNAISVTVPCKEGESEEVNLPAGKAGGESGFTIYPNPNNGTFEISVQNLASATSPFEGGLRGMRVVIYNSIGQLIYSQQINSSDNNFSQTISLNNISSGIYFVRVGDGNNYAEQKLIIE